MSSVLPPKRPALAGETAASDHHDGTTADQEEAECRCAFSFSFFFCEKDLRVPWVNYLFRVVFLTCFDTCVNVSWLGLAFFLQFSFSKFGCGSYCGYNPCVTKLPQSTSSTGSEAVVSGCYYDSSRSKPPCNNAKQILPVGLKRNKTTTGNHYGWRSASDCY